MMASHKLSEVESGNLRVRHAKSSAETIFQALDARSGPFLGTRAPDGHCFEWSSFTTVRDNSLTYGAGLLQLKLAMPGDVVCISAPNVLCATIALLGSAMKGLVCTFLADTWSVKDMALAISQAKIKLVACMGDRVVEWVEAYGLAKYVEMTSSIVAMSDFHAAIGTEPFQSVVSGIDSSLIRLRSLLIRIAYNLFRMDDVLGAGRSMKMQEDSAVIRRVPKALFAIIFTSGSTGSVKGAEFTDEHWKKSYLPVNRYSQGSVFILFESLGWATGLKKLFQILAMGGQAALCADLNKLIDDVHLVRPTHFGAVPQVWQSFMDRFNFDVMKKLADCKGGSHEQQLVRRKVASWYRECFSACGSLTIGGAASSPELRRWMKEVFENKFRESYAATEVGAIAEARGDGQLTIMPSVEFRLRDVPELGYRSRDRPRPRGELLVRVPHAIRQYTNSESTQERFDKDGFFCTGDVVEQLGHRSIKIIDRVSNIVKLQQGLFVTPGTLDQIYLQADSVHQVYIHASPLADAVSAVVVPNYAWCAKELGTCATALQIHVSEGGEIRSRVQDLVRAEFQRLGRRLHRHEVPRTIVLARAPFTVESGLLTPSQKLARAAVAVEYAQDLMQPANVPSGMGAVVAKKNGQDGKNCSTSATHDMASKLFAKLSIAIPTFGTKEWSQFELSTLADIGVGSLHASRFQLQCRRNFGVNVPLHVITSGKPLFELLQSLQEGTSMRSQDVNWQAELQLPDGVDAANSTAPCSGTPSKILLLGSTGFLGRYLLHALLQNSAMEVVCIVRQTADAPAEERLHQALAESLLDLDWLQWQRLQVFDGDVARTRMGLRAEQYLALARSVDVVVNAASKVDYVSGYTRCAPSNVHAVKELLIFCTTEQLKVYHHTSTTSVLPLLPNTGSQSMKPVKAMAAASVTIHLNEGGSFAQAPTETRLQDCSGYVASKAVAECLCHKARMKGVPTTIHRVGMIGPANSTGACQRDNFVTRIFASALQLEKFPCDVPSATPLTLNPVDDVSAGIVFLVLCSHDHAVAGSLLCSHFANSWRSVSFASAWSWFKGDNSSKLEPTKYVQWAKLCSSRDCALTPLLGSLDKFRMNGIGSAVSDAQTREYLQSLAVGNMSSGCSTSEAYFQRMHSYLNLRLDLWYGSNSQSEGRGSMLSESAHQDHIVRPCNG